MYNGIGLQTARGSGTNGYVQRNLSFVKQNKKPIEYKSEDDFARLERELNRPPNQEIIEHQNKRQIEVKCLEMREKMEQQGYTEDKIETEMSKLREELANRLKKKVQNKADWLREHFPQPANVKESHQMAEVNHQKNDAFQSAVKISPYFIAGSSLDPTRKAKEALAKEEQRLRDNKRYALVPDKEPTPEPEVKRADRKEKVKSDSKKDKTDKKRKSRKHSSHSESESDSERSDSSDDSRRKKRKTKSKDKKKDKKQHKRDTKARKKRNYRSSSRSDSDSDSDSSSSSSSSDVLSKTSDSSDSSYYSSKHSRSKRSAPKRPLSPLCSALKAGTRKELSYGKEDYGFSRTSQSIALNIRKVRKEAENSGLIDKDRRPKQLSPHFVKNEYKSSPHKRESSPLRSRPSRSPVRRDKSRSRTPVRVKGRSRSRTPVRKERSRSRTPVRKVRSRSRTPPLKRRHSRSRSSSVSSRHNSGAKRVKSAVYASEKGPKEVPKSYSEKRNRSLSPGERSSSLSDRSRSRSADSSKSSRSSRSSRSRSSSRSSKSRSSSGSASSRSKSRSRSVSIPRRKGSPSFLDKRRITSARKRPIPYRRGSRSGSERSSPHSSMSGSVVGSDWRSHSISSSDSFDSNAYKLI